MAFQAKKWGWKGLAARLLLVPVLAGSAAGTAAAQTTQPLRPAPQTGTQAQPAAALPAAPADPKELVKLAKQALAAGQLDQAQEYVTRANQAATARGFKWGLFDDTPGSVKKDIEAAQAKADKARSEQLFKDAKAAYAKPTKTDADRMANLDQALLLAHQAKNLHGSYSVLDFDRPDKLISEVEAAKAQLRRRMPAATETAAHAPKGAGVMQAAGTTLPGDNKVMPALMSTPKVPAQAPAAAPKAEVAKLVADGRGALKHDRVLEARGKAAQARQIVAEKGLASAFGPAEDTPEALHQACQVKGREMILALTASAEQMAAGKKYAEAESALAYAQQLSEGLGLYTKPIEDQRAKVAALAGKPAPAGGTPAGVPTTVAAAAKAMDAPITPVGLPVAPPGTTLPKPAAPVAPAVASLPAEPRMPAAAGPMTPATPAAAGKVDLLAQAAAEMKRGDLDMARKIAIQAHNTDPAAKPQAQALLRQIDAEEMVVKQRNARTAFDNGMAHFAAKRYESAIAVFNLIDPALMPDDQREKLKGTMKECLAQADAVRPAGGEAPGVARIGGPATPAAPAQTAQKPAAGDSLADQQKALAEVAYQKLRQDGFEALNAANAAWGKGETDAALQALADYAAKVKASTQSPNRQAMLLRPVEERAERFRLLKHHTDFLTKEAKDKTEFRREMVTANVAESQKQEEIKRKVKQINELTKAGKYKDAEAAAAQAKQLDPDDPTLTFIAEQTKMRRRVEDYKTIRSDQEKLFLEGLNDAERPGPIITNDNPLVVNPEIARRAAMRGDGSYLLRTRTPAEMKIEHRLSQPFSFKYENKTLRDVIDDIRKHADLNIVTDSAAIDDEKIALDAVTVTEEVKDLPLKDGLTILLSKARLAHVVENNVVKVTTEKRSKGRMTTKVFHVMDLVTPIPEYKAAPHHRLDTAMEAAKGTLPGALSQMASSGGVKVPSGGLQQGQMVSNGQGVQGSGSTPFLGGTLQNTLQDQPTAMSPQRGQYAGQLMKLITGMVRPYSWQAMNGPGNLEYYDIGGALVVNQTADVIQEVNDLLEALRRLQDVSVSVEIRVISLSESFFERVGVDFAMNVKTNNASFEQQLATSQFRPEPFLNSINANNVTVGYNPAVGGFTPDLAVPIRSTSYGLSLPPFGGYQEALSPTNNGGISLGLAFLNDIQVYMFLEAAQGNRRINVMQAPKVTLFNGQTATVFVGDVAYFTTGLQVFNVGGQFVYLPQNVAFPIGQGTNPSTGQQGGVSVTVQAVVSADRRFVRMNLSPTLTALASTTVPLFPVSTFITPVFEGGSQGQPVPFTQFFQQPSFSEITAQTTVAVPDGGTVLLGGMKTLSQGRNEFGPPVISQVPYLNRLFKNVGVGQETRHVMMMVTPRIIINSEEEARQVGEGGGLVVPQQ